MNRQPNPADIPRDPITFYRSWEDMRDKKPAPGPPWVPSENPDLVRVSDRPPTPVEWLWPGQIPIGKVTMIIGDPGMGKSLIALDIAARVTRRKRWPLEARQGDKKIGRQGEKTSDASRSLSPCLPISLSGQLHPKESTSACPAAGSVLILSAEDDIDDTIRPRLDAAGANPYRVHVLPTITDLRHDMQRLRDAAASVRNCRLIIVDPINAYVGPSDSHFHSVVRKILEPLSRLARERRLAVVAIAHLRKTQGAAIQRAAGTMGFVANSRAVWTVARDPNHSGRNLFVPLKHNLTPHACGLAFRIDIAEVPAPFREDQREGTAAPYIVWSETPLDATPIELLTPKPRHKFSLDREAAQEFLRERLAAGPRPAREIVLEGDEHGFLARTLRRAIHDIGGFVAKRGLEEGWWWALTDFVRADGTKLESEGVDGTPKTSVPFEEDTAKQAVSQALNGQNPPNLQRVLSPSLDDSTAARDLARLDRIEGEIRARRRSGRRKSARAEEEH